MSELNNRNVEIPKPPPPEIPKAARPAEASEHMRPQRIRPDGPPATEARWAQPQDQPDGPDGEGKRPVTRDEVIKLFMKHQEHQNITLELAASYADSFDWKAGEVTLRWATPGEKLGFSYHDPDASFLAPADLDPDLDPDSAAERKGAMFITEDEFRTPPDAREALAMKPKNFGDQSEFKQAGNGADDTSGPTDPDDYREKKWFPNHATFRQEVTVTEPVLILEGPIANGKPPGRKQTALLSPDDYYNKCYVTNLELFGAAEAWVEDWRKERLASASGDS